MRELKLTVDNDDEQMYFIYVSPKTPGAHGNMFHTLIATPPIKRG